MSEMILKAGDCVRLFPDQIPVFGDLIPNHYWKHVPICGEDGLFIVESVCECKTRVLICRGSKPFEWSLAAIKEVVPIENICDSLKQCQIYSNYSG